MTCPGSSTLRTGSARARGGRAEGRRTGNGVHRGDACKEVAREAVATRRGGGVGPIRLDHVVDCGHVDSVLGGSTLSSYRGRQSGTYIGYGDHRCEDHGCDPWDVRGARARPREAKQTDRFERGRWGSELGCDDQGPERDVLKSSQ